MNGFSVYFRPFSMMIPYVNHLVLDPFGKIRRLSMALVMKNKALIGLIAAFSVLILIGVFTS
jgi:hypothetical protein